MTSSIFASSFQSTHPVRGGTGALCEKGGGINISIHPPRAGWDVKDMLPEDDEQIISIHPPRAGWDYVQVFGLVSQHISIHPPRAGWDLLGGGGIDQGGDFNPPTPCGVGPYCYPLINERDEFQSTHPVRGGTCTARWCTAGR